MPLSDVYSVLSYYLHNWDEVEEYLNAGANEGREFRPKTKLGWILPASRTVQFDDHDTKLSSLLRVRLAEHANEFSEPPSVA